MAAKTVDEYIKVQPSPQKEICQSLRKIILENVPNVQEKMFYGAAYYNDGKYYILSLKDHVNLGFEIKNMDQKYLDMLTGGGKTVKILEISSVDEIDESKIVKLLKAVK